MKMLIHHSQEKKKTKQFNKMCSYSIFQNQSPKKKDSLSFPNTFFFTFTTKFCERRNKSIREKGVTKYINVIHLRSIFHPMY